MATSPDSIAYPVQNYGLLGPLPAYVVNIQDVPGADPTGNDDSTDAINAALASLPDAVDGGGELVLAPGIYKFSGPMYIKSGTKISGTGTLKAAPSAQWVQNGMYWGLTNENNDASSITDHDISVKDITIDYTDFPTGSVGTRFAMYFRMAQRIWNSNVRVIGSTDPIAVLGCNQVITENMHAVGFTNCGPDHWEGSNDISVIGGYLESSSTNQMINFNPEPGPGVTPYTCRGFTMTGVHMVFTNRDTPSVVLVEQLYTSGSSVSDVSITGCIFQGVRLGIRGAISNVAVVGNVFDAGGAGEVIFHYVHKGGGPGTGIVINGNVIKNPASTGSNGGVIRCQTEQASVVGNTITGAAYTGQAIYVGTAQPNVLGNRTDIAATPGTLQTGFRLLNSSDNYIGILDASGTTGLRAYCQADNSLIFQTTDGSGAARTFMSLAARSSTSGINWPLPAVFSDLVRIAPATALTATGTTSGTALNLSKNYNEVTTVAAGTGVRLPAAGANQVTGARIVVWNAGANTLNVYPMAGGQIDALGTDIADTIAAGACKTYVAMSSTLYRIET